MSRQYRHVPGRPAVGYVLTTDLEVTQGKTMRCCEHRDGKLIGELSIEVFAAALIIDRDGILAAKAEENVRDTAAIPFCYDGVSGYRADTFDRNSALPYRHVLAIAAEDGVDGGLLITMRCAAPEWPRADELLQSLRLLTRGRTAAND